MTDDTSIQLSLLDNSHAFLSESVNKALAAQQDVRQWQFAITSVVQSFELSLKACLHRIHPAFIYENIDNRKNTVSLRQAVERLENLANVHLSKREASSVKAAVELRNQITHFEYELRSEYAAAKFFETFASVVYFQGRHLNTEIEDIVDRKLLDELLAIEKSRTELAHRARRRIKEENIDGEFVWECPNCLNDTFVAQDEIDTCYTCRFSELVVLCEHCDNCHFESDMQCFEEELDRFRRESGQPGLANPCDYSFNTACPECIDEVVRDIESKCEEVEIERRSYTWHMLEDEYHNRG